MADRSAGAAEGVVGSTEATMLNSSSNSKSAPWNKGRLTGQKRPLKPKDVWAIRVRLQLQHRRRDLALFNLAIDSKLRGCDLMRLQVNDVCVGGQVRDRTTVIQKKTDRPVQFEITEQTRAGIVNLARGGMLLRSVAGGSVRGSRLHAYRADPLSPERGRDA